MRGVQMVEIADLLVERGATVGAEGVAGGRGGGCGHGRGE